MTKTSSFMIRWTVALAVLLPAVSRAQGTTERPPIDFSGVLFLNYQMRVDDAAKATAGGKAPNKFDVERVYLIFRMPVGDRGSMRVTTDIFQNTAAGYYAGWTARLKHAYFQYELSKSFAGVQGLGAVGRFGMLHTVVVDHIETFWPRWLGNTAVERNGFFSSADVGAASLLTIPKRRGEAYITITNGSNYSSAETDRFKDIAARYSFTPFANDTSFMKSFTITPWYYKGADSSRFVRGGGAQVGPVSDGLQKDRRGLFVGLRERRLTAGVDFAQRVEEFETGANTVASPRVVNDRTSQLMDAFVIARPAELMDPKKRSRFGIVARLDQFKFDKSIAASAANPATRFMVLGAIWDLTTRASLSLDYQDLKPQSGSTVVAQKTWFLHWVASF